MTDKKEEWKFIESIEFKEWKDWEKTLFPPFKWGDKVFFWGEDEMQKLIEFYLKDKEIKNSQWEIISAKDNANRFKINCVLGNNWGGKSRLFERIRSEKYTKIYPAFEWCKFLDKLEGWKDANGTIIDNTIYSEKSTKNINWDEEIFVDICTWIIPFLNLKNVFDTFLWINLKKWNIKVGFHFSIWKWTTTWYKKDLIEGIWEKIDIPVEKHWNLNEAIKDKDQKLQQDNGISDIEKKRCENLNKFCNYLNNREMYWGNPFLYSGHKTESRLFKKLFQKNNDFLYFFIFSTWSFDTIYNENSLVKKMKKEWVEEWSINFSKENCLSSCELRSIFGDGVVWHDAYILYSKLIETYSYDDYVDVLSKFFAIIENDFSIELPILDLGWNENGATEFTTVLGSYFNISLKFEEERSIYDLSSWEKIIILRFLRLYSKISNEWQWKKIISLIDEPDLHLHLDWQKKYIQKLIDVFSTLDTNIKLHFVIATHSPFIISDLPAECIVKLQWKGKNEDWSHSKNGTWKYTRITNYDWKEHKSFTNFEEFNKHEFKKKTFWANFVDIINDWFFFDDKVLMWWFSESVIGDVSKNQRKELTKSFDIKESENSEITEQIWDEYLKDNLLYFVKWKKDAED